MFCMLRSCLNTGKLTACSVKPRGEREACHTSSYNTPRVVLPTKAQTTVSQIIFPRCGKYLQNSTAQLHLDHDFIIICIIASQEMRLQNLPICIYNKVLTLEAILMHVKRFPKVDLFKLYIPTEDKERI